MSPRRILFPLLFIIGGILIVSIVFSVIKYSENIRTIKTFPSFSAWTLEGERISIVSQEENTFTCLVFFRPDCNACREKISQIINQGNRVKTLQWLFVTQAPYEDVSRFIVDTGLYRFSNATTLLLDSPELYTKYRISNFPALFLYNPAGDYISRCKDSADFNRFLNSLLKWCREE